MGGRGLLVPPMFRESNPCAESVVPCNGGTGCESDQAGAVVVDFGLCDATCRTADLRCDG
jgi:hypothetical protein